MPMIAPHNAQPIKAWINIMRILLLIGLSIIASPDKEYFGN
jgi:hypothetical protein